MVTAMSEEKIEKLAQKLADYYKVYERTQQILDIGLSTYAEDFKGKFLDFCTACAILDNRETNNIKEVEEKEEKPTTKKK